MGEVYRARDTRLGRDVAIKVLPSHLSLDPDLRERLAREARVISSLAHPHICTLFDVGHEGGVDYLVMEYLQGTSLAGAIGNGPIPFDKLMRYGIEISEAVANAHAHGVVHRDLKPANVMITSSGAKVLDFGLASIQASGLEPTPSDATARHEPLTRAGAVLGTLQYMAPEQLAGREADARSDIYAIGRILEDMVAGRSVPPALAVLIRRCLEHDPGERFQSARDVAFALQDIGNKTPATRSVAPLFIAIAVALLLALGAWFVVRPRPAAAGPRSVAVLPFANLGVDRNHEFLRLAIPDEITTILSYSPGLSVRPFANSRRLSGDIDSKDAAKKLDASQIVTGHVMDENGRLAVTLEAIDTTNDKILWRDNFEVQTADLITMRRELSSRIREGLLPRLSPGGEIREHGGPRNAEAYALFLRAAAISSDPVPNKEGLKLLEQAVRLDPDYAPAWLALSDRAYYDGEYSDGGTARRAQAKDAASRAAALDPDLMHATIQLMIMRTEEGETVEAVRDLKRLLTRRPTSGDAHFAMAMAERYGGSLQESAAECNKAWALDPGNRGFRGCALTFNLLGDYERAFMFLRPDSGTAWSNQVSASALFRQGRFDEAMKILPDGLARPAIVASKSGDQKAVDRAIAQIRQRLETANDGEPFYFFAGYLSVAGQSQTALDFLNRAVDHNFCGVPAADSDPMLETVRRLPGYKAFHDRGIACHEQFIAATRE